MKKFLSNVTNPNILAHLKQFLEKEREKEDKDFAKWKKKHFQTTALNESEAISEESSAEEEENDTGQEESEGSEESDAEEVVSSQYFSVEQKESDDSSTDDPQSIKLSLKTLKKLPINPPSTSKCQETDETDDLSSFFREENPDFETTTSEKTGWALFSDDSDEEVKKISEEKEERYPVEDLREINSQLQKSHEEMQLEERETESSQKSCENLRIGDFEHEESQPEGLSGPKIFKEMQLEEDISSQEDKNNEPSQESCTNLFFKDFEIETQIQGLPRPENYEELPVDEDITSPEEKETVFSQKSCDNLHFGDFKNKSQTENLLRSENPKETQLEEDISSHEEKETKTSPISCEKLHVTSLRTGETQFEELPEMKNDEEIQLEEDIASFEEKETEGPSQDYLKTHGNDEETPQNEDEGIVIPSQYFSSMEEKELTPEPTERSQKKINLKKLSQKSPMASPESEDDEEAVCSQYFPKSQEESPQELSFQEEMDMAAELLKKLVEESETKPKKRRKRKPSNGCQQAVPLKGRRTSEEDEENTLGMLQEPGTSKISQGGPKCRKPKKGKSSQELSSSEDPGVSKEFAPDVLHKYLDYSTFKKRPRRKLPKDPTPTGPPPGALTPLWSPPRSPHGLIEEDYVKNPWGLLVATIFLNKTSGKQAKPIIDAFLKEFPDPYEVLKRDSQDLERFFDDIGLTKRAEQIWKMSREFVGKSWRHAKELHGIGKYGDDAFRIFCLGDLSCEPEDRYLRIYHAWVTKKKDWGSGEGVGEEERSEDVGNFETDGR